MRGRVRPQSEIDSVVARRSNGESIAHIARSTGIPYGTVKNWTRGDIPARQPERCPECKDWKHGLPESAAYAYLLGMYLGDGCLRVGKHSTYLQIACDEVYPEIIAECREAIAAVLPHRKSYLSKSRTSRCVVVASYAPAWECFFPQHGPGRKHDRKIALVPWQQEVQQRHPGALARGLIHSDGWRGLNRVVVKGTEYRYPRYQFSNRSDDIRGIFTQTCDLLGVSWSRWGRWNISVAKRASVARLDEFVGPKR